MWNLVQYPIKITAIGYNMCTARVEDLGNKKLYSLDYDETFKL